MKNNQSKCRSCGELIIWMTTISGKKMPVDYDDEIEDEVVFDTTRMQSHFATCKDANHWRK